MTTANSGLAHNSVRDVAVGEDETFWIVTAGGINRVVDAVWTTYTNANAAACGVVEHATRVAIDDAAGRVWFATDRSGGIDSQPGFGACLFEVGSQTWRRFDTDNSGLADNTVKGIAVDREGKRSMVSAATRFDGRGELSDVNVAQAFDLRL
jgi:hypothetical protein